MAVELKNRIEADLAVVIPMVQLLEGPSSVNQLSQAVFEKLSSCIRRSPEQSCLQRIGFQLGRR